MEEADETELTGNMLTNELCHVSIKNYGDRLELFLPNLKELLDLASTINTPSARYAFTEKRYSTVKSASTVLEISSSANKPKADRTATVKTRLFDIEINSPLDDSTLTNLLRLLGQHTTFSQDEAQVILNLLESTTEYKHIQFEQTGIRIKIKIPTETFVPLYNFPSIINHFIWRKKEIEKLEKLQSNLEARRVVCTVENPSLGTLQITGPGGIGKSALINHFVRLKFREKRYHWAIWFNCGDDESKAESNLLNQFERLGHSLVINSKEYSAPDFRRQIYQRLAAKGIGCFVLDDAPDVIVKLFLPEILSQPQIDVFMTTKNSQLLGPSMQRVTLDVFTLEDAILYTRRILKDSVSDDDAKLLAEKLGHYPLALTQALYYIEENHCTIPEFCQRYESIRIARKEYLNTTAYKEDPYKKSLWVVIQLSLKRVHELCETEEISPDQTVLILKAASYLAPGIPIPKKLLGCLVQKDDGEIILNKILRILCTLSLLEYSEEKKGYRIHQVIQDVLKLMYEPEGRLLDQIAAIIIELFDINVLHPSMELEGRKTLFPHCLTLLENFNRSDVSLKEFKTTIANFECFVGARYKEIYKPTQAYQCFQRALKNFESTNNKILIAETLIKLGEASVALGDPAKAIVHYEQALPILEHIGEHYEIAKALIGLSSVHFTLGEQTKASDLLSRAMAIVKNDIKHDPEVLPKAILILMNLGCVLKNLGMVREAKSHWELLLDFLTPEFDNEHPVLAEILANLGAAAKELGNPDEAKDYLERALPILKRYHGKEHPEVAMIMSNLGAVISTQGDFNRAKEILEQAVSILELSCGKGHPHVAMALLNLGTVNQALGNLTNAKDNFMQALAIYEGVYGRKNPHVGMILLNLATVIQDLGIKIRDLREVAKAKDLLQEALPILVHSYGSDHPFVAKALVNLGTVTLNLGDASGAKDLIDQALAINLRYFSPNTVEVAGTRRELGKSLLALGQFPAALEQFQHCFKILSDRCGDQHRYTREVRVLVEYTTAQIKQNSTRFPRWTSQDNTRTHSGESNLRATRDLQKQPLSQWHTEDPAQAIRRATVGGTLADLSKLLKEFPDQVDIPDQTPDKGLTALHWAVMKCRTEQVRLLLNHLGFTTTLDAQKLSALDYAIYNNDAEILLYFRDALIKKYSQLGIDQSQLPKLVRACANDNNLPGLKLLIHLRVPIDVPGSDTGQTALHFAVKKGNTECVKLLFELGANPDNPDKNGITPRALAENNSSISSIFFGRSRICNCTLL